MCYQAYVYQGLNLTVTQWVCVLELHGTVLSKTAKHYSVCTGNGR